MRILNILKMISLFNERSFSSAGLTSFGERFSGLKIERQLIKAISCSDNFIRRMRLTNANPKEIFLNLKLIRSKIVGTYGWSLCDGDRLKLLVADRSTVNEILYVKFIAKIRF